MSWVMDNVDRQTWDHPMDRPSLAVIPLGTGNDFSRAMGWGPRYASPSVSDVHKAYEKFKNCGDVGMLDRWQVDIITYVDDKKIGLTRTMNNYFSVGCDAEIACDFHQLRQDFPQLANGQMKVHLRCPCMP